MKKALIKDILNAVEGVIRLPQWWSQKLIKRDKRLWTFGAWDGTRYSDNSRVLYEYVIAHYPRIRCYWITNDNDIYNKLKKFNKPVAKFHSIKGIYIQKHAGYFFGTKGLCDGVPWYMNGIHFINLWHGVPIKKIGEDAMERIRDHNTFKKVKTKIRRIIVPWEFQKGTVVCGSPFFVPFFKSAFKIEECNILQLPEPRIDLLLEQREEPLISKLRAKFNNPRIVFYMPTFRDSNFGNFNPFNYALFNADSFGQVLQKNNIIFVYKGHYYDSKITQTPEDRRIINIGDNDYDNLYSFISHTDILITDYSSVYFDYLFLRKPIILFPFDLNEYNHTSRDFYFDYNLMRAKRVYTWDELAKCLQDRTYEVPDNDEINLFRPLKANNCCKNIVSAIMQMQ